MALVVFLRGVNVGGHRTFRPSVLVKTLKAYDVVNIGAAGTFVVRKPGSKANFRNELLKRLPFEAHVVICEGRDLLNLEKENPFEKEQLRTDEVRFVSILSKPYFIEESLPLKLPETGPWLVRIISVRKQFLFGKYRRHMKTIRYLGKIDELFAVPSTIRNWNTISAVIRILKE